MTMEFQERLWTQLAVAAEREAQGGRIRQAVAATRAALTVRDKAAAVAGAAALAVAVAILVAFHPQPQEAQQWRVKQFPLAGRELAAGAASSGSLWTYDTRSSAILQVNPRTQRVLARVPLPTSLPGVAVAAGAGAVWAVPVEPIRHSVPAPSSAPVTLVRIDPRHNRVAARIVLRAPDGSTVRPVGLVVLPDAVWAWGRTGALRIDPAHNRVTRALRVPDESFTGFVATDGWAAAVTDVGRLVTFDARSGARLRSTDVPIANGSGQTLAAARGGVVVDFQDGSIASIDPMTGRTRWTARLTNEGDIVATADRIWVLLSEPGRDRLRALDPATGRTVARITLPADDVHAITTAGNSILATTEQGHVITVRPR